MNTISALAALPFLTIMAGGTVAGSPLVQQAYVKASNSGRYDQFGYPGRGVALEGDTMVVGAPGDDSPAKGVGGDQGDGLDPTPLNPQNGFDSGAAFVFWRHGSGWSQQAYLKSTDTAKGDCFGRAVAVSGDTVLVGAVGTRGKEGGLPFNGSVYVFVREGSNWTQQACLKVPEEPGGVGGGFGGAVAISGDTAVVGADREASAGSEKPGGPVKKGELMAGAVHVFVREGGIWRRQARLEASNAGYKTHFGTSVAISGDTLVVGAIGESSDAGGINGDQTNRNALNSGAAYVFVREGAAWRQQAYLKAPNPREFDEFGASVAISGNSAVVGAANGGAGSAKPAKKGAARDDKGDDPGAAFVFVRNGDAWSGQASLIPPGFKGGEGFGSSVSISGDRLVVGAIKAGDKDREYAGAAFVYARSGTAWDRGTRVMASNAERGDQFGGTVAISGNTLAVGAAGEESFGRGVNGDQSDKPPGNTDSGAAYVFVSPGVDGGKEEKPGVGEKEGTLEERMLGYWATDWEAMAESWQPMIKGMAELGTRNGKERAAAEKKGEEEMRQVFATVTVEIKKGEIIFNDYSAGPPRMTYLPKSQDPATGILEMQMEVPDSEPTSWRATLAGDRLTLIGREDGEENSLPMVLKRIDAAEFEKRRKAAAAGKPKENP